MLLVTLRTEATFPDPSGVYRISVLSDLTHLFRRAARKLGTPETIERAAARVPEKYRRMAESTLLKDSVVPSAQIVDPSDPEQLRTKRPPQHPGLTCVSRVSPRRSRGISSHWPCAHFLLREMVSRSAMSLVYFV